MDPLIQELDLVFGRGRGEQEVKDYVLSRFDKNEQRSVNIILDKVSRNINFLLKGDTVSFLNKFYL